jgi:hypothetical protein
VFWQVAKIKNSAKRWAETFKRIVKGGVDMGDLPLPVLMLVLQPGNRKTLSDCSYRDLVRQQQLSVQLAYLTPSVMTQYSDHIPHEDGGPGRVGPDKCRDSSRSLTIPFLGNRHGLTLRDLLVTL